MARKDGRVHSLNDLKGKTFAYVDKKSASGYLYARDMIKQNHMDAGATYDEVYNQAHADGLFTDELIIIARTEEIPKDALAARKDMPSMLMEKLRSAFVDFSNSSGIDTTVQGFVRNEDKAYDIIRRLNN